MNRYVESFLAAAMVCAILAIFGMVCVAALGAFGPMGLLAPAFFLIVWRLTHAFIKEVM